MSEPAGTTPAGTTPAGTTPADAPVPQTEVGAVEGGAYELLVSRLQAAARELSSRAAALNEARLAEFGSSEMKVVGTQRLRTENNTVPRDMVAVGGLLLFGYNVHMGLKASTKVSDVFSLYRLGREGEGHTLAELAAEDDTNFLADERFIRDFSELYAYYKDSSLLDLRATDNRLLAAFQTGRTLADLKVFRWEVSPAGEVSYIDSRGERDYPAAQRFDFEWTTASREEYVGGRYPHINVLDEVFVDPLRGTLELRVEDGTDRGRVILSEPVAELEQDLTDCEVRYAQVGSLILLGIRPYREPDERIYIYTLASESVVRRDAAGTTCVTLPEDHGVIFPDGMHLQDGTHKSFELDVAQMEFVFTRFSPNGEDVLYVFRRRDTGSYVLLSYNLIRKELANPISCHGASVFADGTLVVFREDPAGPARIHALQIWDSPYTSREHAAGALREDSELGRIGNAELVRAISEALSLRRLVDTPSPTMHTYESIVRSSVRMEDAHHWLAEAGLGDLATPLRDLRDAGELILDEFEKVQEARRNAQSALGEASERLDAQIRELSGTLLTASEHISGLARLREAEGLILTLADRRYMDLTALEVLGERVRERFSSLAGQTVEFLSTPGAFAELHQRVAGVLTRAESLGAAREAAALRDELGGVADELGVLSSVVSGLEVADVPVRTAILEEVAVVLGELNRARAVLDGRVRALRETESAAAFAAEFALLTQSVGAALAAASTPEEAEAQLGRLMVSVENLEASFADVPEHATALEAKREEIYEALTSRKQALLDERAAHATRLLDAARRILAGVAKRTATLASPEALAAFFASDPMIVKVLRSSRELRELGENVSADELEGAVKAARTEAIRGLRDRTDLFEGGDLIRFGTHRFSVSTAPLELTLATTSQGPELLLAGTDWRVPLPPGTLGENASFWSQPLVSETPEVYRGEHLAAALWLGAERDAAARSELSKAQLAGALPQLVTAALSARFDEGYERGVHDRDAAMILSAVLSLASAAGLARFGAPVRTLAQLYWARLSAEAGTALVGRARSAAGLRDSMGSSAGVEDLRAELCGAMELLAEEFAAAGVLGSPQEAAAYLVEELGAAGVDASTPRFLRTGEAASLTQSFAAHLGEVALRELQGILAGLGPTPQALRLAAAWLAAHAAGRSDEVAAAEVLAELLLPSLSRYDSSAPVRTELTGLLGSHPRIEGGRMELRLDEFSSRLRHHLEVAVPAYRAYQRERHELLAAERRRLRLSELEPKVMSSFVRNRLIDRVYLPLIGDNLAKQIGEAGTARRTDQQGLLLVLSPPGYGKTTLMEYVAHRLGMVLVKVNGPALGHEVTSLDPQDAPNATARREIERLNFALQMGSNVMLYLDDIQHTNPELLQKFISLADATRRIEGVVEGEARTFDLRGKRFAVVMAGNPYTESGEKFRIPDMLANRADTYNLGEVLTGNDELFALSYIENALTSNPTLAPLAGRDPGDIELLVRMSAGEPVESSRLSHPYTESELRDIKAVLTHMRTVQQLLLKVNAQYVASASQADIHRTEPPFLLQGSYRNMGRLAARIVPVMSSDELESLLDDHYTSEAQTLTSGTEENLLKLAEIRGKLTPEEALRWEEIKRGYVRNASVGAEVDPATRIANAITSIGDRLEHLAPPPVQHGMGAADLDAVLRAIAADIPEPVMRARFLGLVHGLQEAAAADEPHPAQPAQPAQASSVSTSDGAKPAAQVAVPKPPPAKRTRTRRSPDSGS